MTTREDEKLHQVWDAHDLLHAAAVELLAELLDDLVPLGEMHRYVASVRETLSERERGIIEHITPAGDAARVAAHTLVTLLATPLKLEVVKRYDVAGDDDEWPEYDGPAPEARDEDGAPLDMTPRHDDEEL